jgi:hypothetical protein
VGVDNAAVAFSEWLRDTDSFTEAAARWLGRRVDYQLVSQQESVARGADVPYLDVAPGTPVLRRQGFLQALLDDGDDRTGPGRPSIVADVRSVVLVAQLSTAAAQALARGDTPLGSVFAPHIVRRHPHAVVRMSVAETHGPQALRVHATLTVSGRPVATVEEIVYQILLDSRCTGEGVVRAH